MANGGQFVDLDIASASLPAVAADFDLEPLRQPILQTPLFFLFYFAKKTITIKNYLLLQLKWHERGALEEKKNSLKKLFLRSARPCKFPRPSSEMRGGGYTSSRYSLGHVWVTEL